eukprot:1945062-Pleurochrysis_carterae.AAC.3
MQSHAFSRTLTLVESLLLSQPSSPGGARRGAEKVEKLGANKQRKAQTGRWGCASASLDALLDT